jgi:hypothetical protein
MPRAQDALERPTYSGLDQTMRVLPAAARSS